MKTILFAAAMFAAVATVQAGEVIIFNGDVAERVSYTEKTVKSEGAGCQNIMYLRMLYNDKSLFEDFAGTGRCMAMRVGDTAKVVKGTMRDGVTTVYAHKQLFVVPAYVFSD